MHKSPILTASGMSGSIPKLTPGKPGVGAELAKRARERQEKNRYVITSEFPALQSVTEPAFLGGFSWQLPRSGTRILDQLQVLDIGNGPQTPAELARDYLAAKYAYPLRANKRQRDAIHMPRAQAMFALPGKLENAVYLDIVSAYFSIMCIVGATPDYSPNRFLGAGDPPLDFPAPAHKVSRNCLVSAGLSTAVQYWTGSTIETKKSFNPVYNMGLWACIQDILHGVAADLIDRAGAVYFNVDGAIIPEVALNAGLDAVSAWGLRARVKAQGRAEVFGVGSYRVGSKRTRTRARADNGAFYGINDFVNRNELRSTVHRLSRRAILPYFE